MLKFTYTTLLRAYIKIISRANYLSGYLSIQSKFGKANELRKLLAKYTKDST